MNLKNKKAEFLADVTTFIIANVLFFALLFYIVSQAGTGASIAEQVYSKKIALIIDSMQPGTETRIDVSKLTEISKKNNINSDIISFDFNNNKITIKLSNGEGHSYYYFSNLKSGDVSWYGDKILIIKMS